MEPQDAGTPTAASIQMQQHTIAVPPYHGYQPTTRRDRERRWAVMAVAVGAVLTILMLATVVPMVLSVYSAIGQIGSTGDELSPIYPADGSSVDTTTISLSWDDVDGAERYEVRISESSSMASSSMFTTADSSIAITSLDIGSTYYWQVRAVVDGERQGWSEAWSFTVGSENGAPVTTSPSNGTIYIDELPVLTWSALGTSSEYMVQVSSDEDFGDVLIDAKVSGTSYSIDTALEENTTYFWRVAGSEDGSWTEWSTVSSFVISPSTIEVTRSWTFYADGSEWTLSVNVSAEDYYTAKYTARATIYNVNQYAGYVTTTDAAVVEVAEALASMAESKGYDEYTTACFVLSFVQNFTYESDENSTGYEDYPRYAIETLVDGEGDCEDTSALFASLIQAEPFGMDAVLVSLSTPTSDVGHMAVGLYLDDVPSEVSFTYNGTAYTMMEEELLSWEVRTYHFGDTYTYWYCEPTSEMPIGWPTDIEDWYYTLIAC